VVGLDFSVMCRYASTLRDLGTKIAIFFVSLLFAGFSTIFSRNFALNTTVRFKAKKYVFFGRGFVLFFNENDPLNRFIHSKMRNYVSFCLKIAPGEIFFEKGCFL
jgi:hypothetical protein